MIAARVAVCAALCAVAVARTPELLALSGDIERVHDPAIIRQGNTYYLFCTGHAPGGGGIIPIRASKDLRHWTLSGAVFDKLPDWATKGDSRRAGCLGTRHLVLQRPVSPVLRCVGFR